MSKRINTPFTNEHFADWCLKMAEKKSPYWYGTCAYKASSSLLSSKSRQYPSHYGSNRSSRYKKDIANKMVVADCVCRMVPGVLSDPSCFEDESHWAGLLEYPQYSRPAEWHGRAVPEILLSGDHGAVDRWRKKQSILRTFHRRPDLFQSVVIPSKTKAEKKFLAELEEEDDEFRNRNAQTVGK